MTKLIDSLGITELMRWFAAGAFFLGTFLLLRAPLSDICRLSATLDDNLHPGLLILLALLIGLTLYGIHRSLVYPLIEYIIVRRVTSELSIHFRCSGKGRFWYMPQHSVFHMDQLWSGLASEHTIVRSRYERFVEWGNIVHMQYTTALAILAATLTSALCVPPSGDIRHVIAASLFLLLISAALFSNYRLVAMNHILIDKTFRDLRMQP